MSNRSHTIQVTDDLCVLTKDVQRVEVWPGPTADHPAELVVVMEVGGHISAYANSLADARLRMQEIKLELDAYYNAAT